MLHWPVTPVSAVPARSLPESPTSATAFEMKWDGSTDMVVSQPKPRNRDSTAVAVLNPVYVGRA